MRKSYPSDISCEQFSKIEPLLSGARKVTHPRELDLYDVFCAVLYLLKTACQWRCVVASIKLCHIKKLHIEG